MDPDAEVVKILGRPPPPHPPSIVTIERMKVERVELY